LKRKHYFHLSQLFFSLTYTLAVSLYESANQFRRALLAQETQARARLVSAYLPILDNLSYRLAQLLAQIEAAQRDGRTLSKWELQREQRFRLLIAQAAQQIQLYANRIPGLLTVEQQRAVDAALIHAPQLLAEASGEIAQAFNRLPREAVAQFVGLAGDGSPLNKSFRRYGHEKAELLKQVLLDGLAQGRGLRVIGREAAAVLARPRWEAERLARTELLRSYRESSRAIYQESGIVTGWQWLSAKSTRTCLACLALDGQVFPLNKPMPAHPNCRCAVVPLVQGATLPQRQTGKQWFAAQSAAVKREMLGSAAYSVFQSGEITLADFVGLRRSREWGEMRYQRSLQEALQ
jgi:SPP1 gp7 family putative phage head morphogenesis protein